MAKPHSAKGRVRTGLATASLLPLLAGCYSYTQVPLESAPLGEDVRLTVTRAGALDVLNVIETEDAAPQFVGNYEGREGESLLVRVPGPSDPASSASGVRIGQMVRVPSREILSVEMREIDMLKTGGLIAALAGVGTFLIVQIIDAGGDEGREGEDPDFSIGLFQIPIG